MKSTPFKIFSALRLISSRFPIGVETIYKPISSFSIIFIFIFIVSCVPVKNEFLKQTSINQQKKETDKAENNILEKESNKKNLIEAYNNTFLNQEVEVVLPRYENKNITDHLINSLELAVYKKKLNKVSLNINFYSDLEELKLILKNKVSPGKIFIGTLASQDSLEIKNFCKQGILFFSFASDKKIANECSYLINFFPEDDLKALFSFFPENSKIALLFPENSYGKNINKIIDSAVLNSGSLLINRVSYKEDLSDARASIKELSKYELRKLELERQKKILKKKDDKISKQALKKIKRFETIGQLDFTHIILPDYGIRLLEIAPLLPFYDVDPNLVQFVGTGVWDDKIFFDEPSLQGAIFPGIEAKERKDFFNFYELIYNKNPIRTATIPYDLLGIINYILSKEMTIKDAYNLLDNSNIKFSGIDGEFSFIDNVIFRELKILKIEKGKARKLN